MAFVFRGAAPEAHARSSAWWQLHLAHLEAERSREMRRCGVLSVDEARRRAREALGMAPL